MIRIVHERTLEGTPDHAGRLIDGLASEDDRLWPSERWPAIHFDRPLGVGARGGHGPVRYTVCEYEPGRLVRLRFDPAMFAGHHWFEIATRDRQTMIRHGLEGRPRGWMRLAWPLAFRALHNAASRDSVDHAAAQLRGTVWQPRKLGAWVRMLRSVGRLVLGEDTVPRDPEPDNLSHRPMPYSCAVGDPVLTGGCLCGAVRFELTEPPASAGYCHCTRCQRRTGTASSVQARIDGGTLRLLRGEEMLTAWRHPDGGHEKLFCAECGAHLFSRNPQDHAQMSVRMGAFDGDPGVRPAWRAYAAPWEPTPDDRHECFPEGKPYCE